MEERGLAVARWWNISQAFEKWWAVVSEKVISSRVQATTSEPWGEETSWKDVEDWKSSEYILYADPLPDMPLFFAQVEKCMQRADPISSQRREGNLARRTSIRRNEGGSGAVIWSSI